MAVRGPANGGARTIATAAGRRRTAAAVAVVLGAVIVAGCGPTPPIVMTRTPTVSRFDSALTDSARARGRVWREAHFPTADLHGPFPRPALPDTADPNDAVAYYRLGLDKMDSEQGLADRAFYWATRLEPYFAEAYYARWVLRRQRWSMRLLPDSTIRRHDDAGAAAADSLLDRAISYDPFVNEPIDGRRFAPYFSRPGRRQRDPTVNGVEAYLDRNYAKALTLWGQAIRREPRAVLLRIPRAYAWVRMGKPDSAIAELSTLVDRLESIQRDSVIAPYLSKERFYYAIGFLHVRQDHLAEARTAYQRALAENLGFYIVHVRLAGVALAERDTASALTSIETALLIEPDDAFVRVYYGAMLTEAGRVAEARRQLETVIRANPDYALPHLYLGRALERGGDTVAARSAYAAYLARASRTAPDRHWAQSRLGSP